MANTYAGYSVNYYETAPPHTGHGMVGTINDDGSTVAASPDLQTGLNGDPTAQGFVDSNVNPAVLRVAVTQDPPLTPPSAGVKIYDPSSSSLITSTNWSGVNNLYAVVPLGSYFYALDFDSASVIELDSSYAETGNKFTLTTLIPSGFTPYGQALFTANGDLYGVFIFFNSSTYPPPFANSLLVNFSVTPGASPTGSITIADSSSDLAPNTAGVSFDGSQFLYTAAIGGGQSDTYNAASAIQQIDLTTSPPAVTTLLSGSDTETDYLDISTDGAGNFYVLSGLYNSGFTALNSLLQSTSDFSSFTTIDSTSAGGFCWFAQYTPENARIWEARGSEIVIYDATASPVSTVATLNYAPPVSHPDWSLISSGEDFNTLNSFSYVGAESGEGFSRRGSTSPILASNKAWAKKARAISEGRPYLIREEWELLQRELDKA
jgi:hypothetical protein